MTQPQCPQVTSAKARSGRNADSKATAAQQNEKRRKKELMGGPGNVWGGRPIAGIGALARRRPHTVDRPTGNQLGGIAGQNRSRQIFRRGFPRISNVEPWACPTDGARVARDLRLDTGTRSRGRRIDRMGLSNLWPKRLRLFRELQPRRDDQPEQPASDKAANVGEVGNEGRRKPLSDLPQGP